MPARDLHGYGPMDIFVIAGQSNPSGRGALADVPSFAYRDRVRMWMQNGTGFAPAAEPVDTDLGGAQYSILGESGGALASPCVAFGNKYAQLRSTTVVGLALSALGGTFISSWARNLSTATLYGAMIARTQAALAFAATGSRIAGFIWYQGESEAIDGTGLSAWDSNFTQLIADVRSDLSLPSLPCIMTVLGPTPSSGFSQWTAMVSLQQGMTLPSGVSRISANDLTAQSASSPHLTTASYVTLGERWANEMNSIVS